LVLFTVATLTGLQAAASMNQFDHTAESYKSKVQAQARELGATVSHTLSLTAASALRDSDYAFLNDLAQKIVAQNPNVLGVQIIEPSGKVVADSDPNAKAASLPPGTGERRWEISVFQGVPVYEYDEPVEFGSSHGKGRVLMRYSLQPVQELLEELEANKRASLSRLLNRTLVLGLVLAVLGAIVGVYFSRRVTRPVVALTAAARELAEGNLQARVNLDGRAGSEIQNLGQVFNQMAEHIASLSGPNPAKRERTSSKITPRSS
jgi:sigma-B regulation protein RsbU (phosphoserine phosphatase)